MMPQYPNLSLEIPLWETGLVTLAGLDEAGRGAWAGPVSAGAVVLPVDIDLCQELPGVRDSKQMTALQRSLWAERIKKMAVSWGVGFASQAEIDARGIVPATRLAMQRAVEQLLVVPQHLLIDALRLPSLKIPQTSLIKGDVRSLTIAAASVLAKSSRDALMCELDGQYPGYGFARHKGYGTHFHQQALQRLGPCLIHRLSFAPLKNL
ncbi:MAG: ribonuclease HII [Anaerolineaceae bacterium]|nr:ribonuclease HII [Anaerolineaceae bacterium]